MIHVTFSPGDLYIRPDISTAPHSMTGLSHRCKEHTMVPQWSCRIFTHVGHRSLDGAYKSLTRHQGDGSILR